VVGRTSTPLSAGHITTLTRGGPYVDPVVSWRHHHANLWWAVDLVVSWTHHHANPWWAVDLGAALVVFGVLLTSRAENYGIVI